MLKAVGFRVNLKNCIMKIIDCGKINFGIDDSLNKSELQKLSGGDSGSISVDGSINAAPCGVQTCAADVCGIDLCVVDACGANACGIDLITICGADAGPAKR